MKTTKQIYDQWQRIFRTINSLGRRNAAKAHPETRGNGLMVHNWGNQAAKDAWARSGKRVTRVRAIYREAYDLAEHRFHVQLPDFHPIWCKYCNK